MENARVQAQLLATPILNRGMVAPTQSADTNDPLLSSAQGLGRMYFVRSVIDHHRQGGDEDQIESFVNAAETEALHWRQGLGWGQLRQPCTRAMTTTTRTGTTTTRTETSTRDSSITDQIIQNRVI
jgi:hypothetical protein